MISALDFAFACFALGPWLMSGAPSSASRRSERQESCWRPGGAQGVLHIGVWRCGSLISVALVGPDGAGKSTVSRLLENEALPARVKRIYMGVNLEQGGPMLPTTRLALAVKRARSRRPDMSLRTGVGDQGDAASGGLGRRAGRGAVRGVRMALWVGEEWFRQAVAAAYRRRGWIVVYDRHFFVDYYHYDVVGAGTRPVSARVHGFLLRHLYPKPDLVVYLDAPAEVLFQRKGEASPDWLEARRGQYLELREAVPHFVTVDGARPVEQVTHEVARIITSFYDGKRR